MALRGTQPMFYALFLEIALSADVVWPPRSCLLTPLNYYLWDTVKDKCYADKPETIDALKDNIREGIGEIQSIMGLKIGPIIWATTWLGETAISMKSFSIINRKDCTSN